MKIWQPTYQTLTELCQNSTLNNAVIKGLGRQRWAFMLAAPGVGKSSLMIATALEVAIGKSIIGLIPDKAPPRRVLYWAHEDRASELSHRLIQIRSELTDKQQLLFEENFGILDSEQAIFCSATASDKIQLATMKVRTELIQAINDFAADLVIIDCIRTVKGTADVVADEVNINLAMREMALATEAAFIAVHHLTKAAAQDPSIVTNTSGTGLSEAQSESKLHLYLRNEKVKGKVEPVLKLSHIKANFLPKNNWLTDVELKQSNLGLIYNPEFYTSKVNYDLKESYDTGKPPSSSMEQYLIKSENELSHIDPVVIDVAAKKAELNLNQQTEKNSQPDIFGVNLLKNKRAILREIKKDIDK